MRNFSPVFFLDAGYVNIKKVDSFGLFDDASCFKYKGVAISLNLIAEKSGTQIPETTKKTL
ncbi:MAG: hypothetical protein QM479_07410 [Pseudomonadota bacterium]